jgi:hypothetical protein
MVQAASRPQQLACLGSVLLKMKRPHEALIAAREAQALLDSLGGVEEGESLVRITFAEALHANGETEAARAAIRIARDRVLERATKITDAEWRTSFLQNLPENARTLSVARELLAK